MVRRRLAAASTVWYLVGAVGGSPSMAANRVSPLTVREVAITANGARSTTVSGEETAADCARFRLAPADVRRYFGKAGRVDSPSYNHDLDMSRCHAAGTVRFANGWRGRWTIDRARRAALMLADGRRLYFYCVDCAATPFDPLDDEDRENGRALIRAARAER